MCQWSFALSKMEVVVHNLWMCQGILALSKVSQLSSVCISFFVSHQPPRFLNLNSAHRACPSRQQRFEHYILCWHTRGLYPSTGYNSISRDAQETTKPMRRPWYHQGFQAKLVVTIYVLLVLGRYWWLFISPLWSLSQLYGHKLWGLYRISLSSRMLAMLYGLYRYREIRRYEVCDRFGKWRRRSSIETSSVHPFYCKVFNHKSVSSFSRKSAKGISRATGPNWVLHNSRYQIDYTIAWCKNTA